MATKIINILQDDSFEGILHIFKETPATEVIFILPRKHEALSSEEHFATLAETAQECEKTPLILAANPEILAMAAQYNIGVLTSAKAVTKTPVKKLKKPIKPAQKAEPKSIPVIEESEDVVEEPEEAVEISEVEKENMPEEVEEVPEQTIDEDHDGQEDVSLEPAEPNRMMVDIIQPPQKQEEKFSVRVEEPAVEESPMEVQINKEEKKQPIDDIQSVWRSRSSESIKSPSDDNSRPAFIKNGFRVDFPPFLRFLGRPLVLLGLASVIIFGIVLYVSTGSAKIIVKPRSQPLEFALKVSASDKFLVVDRESEQIPGQLFSVDKKIEETFPATGERDVVQKARGRLTIYNEYGTTPQKLVAGTRFESEAGLIFKTLNAVTVPGTTVKNGEITPGSIMVEVIADKAGDTYNIASGRFTIPAFKEQGLMDRYNKFYGKSSEAMKGGIIGKAKVVTEQDLMSAKKKIEERILSETEQEIKSQSAGLKILSLTQPAIKEITSSAQIDEATNEFVVSGAAQLQTVGFKESDLNDLISQYVGHINDLVVLPEKLQIDYSEIVFSDGDKTLKFTVSVKGPAYNRIDEAKIINDLIGKDEDSITEYIKGVNEIISSARVILSPFWVRRVPENKEKIKLELQYD